VIGILAAWIALGCDRAIEPYVPGEKPEQPDLSRIFPEGAERAPKEGPMGGTGAGMSAAAARNGDAGNAAPPPASGSEAQPVSGTITLAPDFDASYPPACPLRHRADRAGRRPPLAVKRIESRASRSSSRSARTTA
jgi:hypothetical protein